MNAVAHRDYSILGTDIMVKIFDHHYVVESLGILPGMVRIIKAPAFVIDYVITHELCHTIIMKHTVKFETLLNSHCPDCKQVRIWLEKYGNSL